MIVLVLIVVPEQSLVSCSDRVAFVFLVAKAAFWFRGGGLMTCHLLFFLGKAL